MEIYAVIMAGGVGSRFWPRSKVKQPKQLLNIFGDSTMIESTIHRLDGIVPKENVIIITNEAQQEAVMETLVDIPKENVIAEPFGKNTAPCIGLASVLIESKKEDAVMITLPADHLIHDVELFQKTLQKAIDFAYESKGLVTLGITPTRPETGYGYIQVSNQTADGQIYKVNTFAEKPNYATAKRFLESGDFYWNSGMFIWRVDAIRKELKKLMPELDEGLNELKPAIESENFDEKLVEVYGKLKSISIDYGVMEKSKNVYLIKGDFDWNDVGSWEAVYELSKKDKDDNALEGDVYAYNSYGSYVYSPDKFTAVVGLENVIVINTKDGLLVCHRDHAQDVKQVVEHLKYHERDELL